MANTKTTQTKTTKKQAQTKSNQADNKAKTAQQAQADAQAQAQQDNFEELIAKNDSFVIKFSWTQVKPVYQQKLKRFAQNLKLKGFRQGKVPLTIAEKEINQEKLVNEVLKELLPDAYKQEIEKNNFKPISDPEFHAISLNKDNDWEVKAVFAQKPAIKLAGYQKVTQEAKKKAKKEIAEHNKKAQAQAKEKPKAKPKKTQAKKSKKTSSDSAQKQAQTQPLNQQQQDDAIIQTIFGALVKKIKPAIPEILIKQNTQQELNNLGQKLKELNIEVEDFLKSRNMTQDQLTMQMAYSSLNQLQVEFLLNAIAEQEKITVEDQEVEERIKAIEDETTRNRMAKDTGYRNYLKAMLAKQKVIKHLLEI